MSLQHLSSTKSRKASEPAHLYAVQQCSLEKTENLLASDKPCCAFTIDVEDWYQSTIDFDAPITERVIHNMDRVLTLLDEFQIKGTFFVQGRVAETFPHLVQRFVQEGHEIQSHGYSHKPLFAMDRNTLTDELERAKKTVEDAAGVAVTAFRAQDFSIVQENLWALEVLVDVGFSCDSSLFPMQTHRYGIANWELAPHQIHLPDGTSIIEVPVAVWNTRYARLPVAGGGYFRLLPLPMLHYALRSIAHHRPVVIYCHPYEFNPAEMHEYRGQIKTNTRLSQQMGRQNFTSKLTHLFRQLPFGRFDTVLSTWGVL